ncbi:hypothetical protein DPMN_109418 [Dreissena polymorpha]|uniref:Uncharacterized protein n=1 Tax=Dreissena polymorpha TaxID=45954 RepID=A0A9D4KAQ2_DREPO|nr:hypothetical protein DPMN_109418 [Dreissena polymorpha]
MDKAVQTVRDLFDMSNKALDQAGRAGAFHHLVRRKAAVTDTGLSTLKDIHSKVMYLPLSSEGVFDSGLHSKLKSRKEQKDQLNDLMPEFFDKHKRKFVSNAYDTVRSAYKKPRLHYQSGRSRPSYQLSYSANNENRQKQSFSVARSQGPKEKEVSVTPSFRIPKKQEQGKPQFVSQSSDTGIRSPQIFSTKMGRNNIRQMGVRHNKKGIFSGVQRNSHISGIKRTLVPKKVHIITKEISCLKKKDAIELVPIHQQNQGFYSTFFLVPK